MRKPVSDCPESFLKALPVVGERIAYLRRLYAWTQRDLATVAGLSLHYIRAIEQAQLVDTWVLWRVCEAMKVQFYVVFFHQPRWTKVVAVREQEVGWDPKTEKPRAKHAGAGVELWETEA